MNDLYDEYLDQILVNEDRILFEEAVRCARAGCLRAAYIVTWITVAEALKRRFKEAAIRDHAAGKIVGEVESRESSHQAVDKLLIEKAKQYGMLLGSEHTRLEHVYEMRCVFGHPYEENPSLPTLHSAMSDVIEIVLSRPTKLRQGFIAGQVELLTTNSSFLDDLEEAVARHAQDVRIKVAEDLHGDLVGELLKKLEPLAHDPSMALFIRRGQWFLKAYISVDIASFFLVWDAVNALTKYPNSAAFLLANAEFWPHLSGHAHEMTIGEALRLGETSGEYLRRLQDLHTAEVLTKREEERCADALGEMDPAFLASAGISARYFADTLICKLKSHDWYTQNPAIEVLRNLGPASIGDLPANTQFRLGNNVLQCADGKARAALAFLDAIAVGPSEWPEPFISGIVQECFVNDSNQIRFKNDELRRALSCLRSVPKGAVNRIVEQTADRIREGELKTWIWESDQNEAVTELENIANFADATPLQQLKEAVLALKRGEDELFE